MSKISFNNNEVEHNREPLFPTTYLNLLEYSPDYASSVAVQYGFVEDTAREIQQQLIIQEIVLLRSELLHR